MGIQISKSLHLYLPTAAYTHLLNVSWNSRSCVSLFLSFSCYCFKHPRTFLCPLLFILPLFLLMHVSFLTEVRLVIRFRLFLSLCFQGEQTACWMHCNSAFYCHHSSAAQLALQDLTISKINYVQTYLTETTVTIFVND